MNLLNIRRGDLFSFKHHKAIYMLVDFKLNPSYKKVGDVFLFEFKNIRTYKSNYTSDLKKEIILVKKKII